MIVDKMVFSDAQNATQSAAFNSTDTIDTEVAGSNIGGGTPIWLVCRVNTTFTCLAGTFTAALQTCFESGGTYQSILVSPAWSLVQLAKGFDILTAPLPADNLRYLRMLYTPSAGTGAVVAKVDALLTLNAPRN